MIESICRQCGRTATVRSLQAECDYCHGPDTLEELVWPESTRSGCSEPETTPPARGNASRSGFFVGGFGGWRKRKSKGRRAKLLFALSVLVVMVFTGCATSRSTDLVIRCPDATAAHPEVEVAVRVQSFHR